MARSPRGFALSQGVVPFLVLLAVSAALYAALWLLDFGVAAQSPLALWSAPATYDVLVQFTQVTIGVLGIAITVVAIIVELAANRYTPRITELFVRDPTNVAVMGFFVVSSVLVVWIDLSLHGEPHPRAMALAASVVQTVSLLVILPYFAYVFDFLSPTRVIDRIQQAGSDHLARLVRGAVSVEVARAGVVQAVEQLGDIALNSIEKKDKPLTLAAIAALERVTLDAIRAKDRLPREWFDTRPLGRHDQDFIALHPDMVRALTDRRTWLEMKVLRQYQSVFGEAVNRMRDVNHLVAIHTRQVAVAAMDAGDPHALQLAIRFLNTYLRNAINARDVRSVYNLLNDYRLVAEHALEHDADEVVLQVAGFNKFYGQLAFAMQLPFLLETAAFDLCMRLEAAYARDAGCHDRLLGVFLELDREPEGDRTQEASLRGVRKAQVRLATCYLKADDEPHARRIWEDMRSEQPERLRSIRAELERVEAQEYWEVSDRGINFEWLPPERRATLGRFFGWFGPG